MKILITGGLGHIGSYLLQNIDKIKILKKIYVIDDLSTQRYCSLFYLPKTRKKIFFVQKDLSLKNALNNTQKVDVVIILAWNYSTPIMQNHSEFLEKGGVFLIPLPNLKVIGQP